MSLHEHDHRRPRHSPPSSGLSGVPRATEPGAVRPQPFEVEVRPARERAIVVPHGELDLTTRDAVAETVDGLAEAEFEEIVLDLRSVTFMDSSGLCLVIEQTRRPDARVRVIDGAAPVARLFDLTGVRSVLPFLAPHEVLLAR
jgi:anti-sigma B factor antagonist